MLPYTEVFSMVYDYARKADLSKRFSKRNLGVLLPRIFQRYLNNSDSEKLLNTKLFFFSEFELTGSYL